MQLVLLRQCLSAMATVGVLERREKKAYVDDTIPLTAIITTYKVLPSHAVRTWTYKFILRVQGTGKTVARMIHRDGHPWVSVYGDLTVTIMGR